MGFHSAGTYSVLVRLPLDMVAANSSWAFPAGPPHQRLTHSPKKELTGYRELTNQGQHEIGGISARLDNARKRLTLLQEQILLNEELMKSALSIRMLHPNFVNDAPDLNGKIGEDSASLNCAKAAYREAKVNIKTFINTVQERVYKDLELKSHALEELSNRLETFTDSLKCRALDPPSILW